MFPNLTSGRVCRVTRLLIAAIAAVLPVSGEELKDGLFLGGKHPRFDGYEGYALRRVVPLNELPDRIKFEPGKLSLIPDPTDWRGIYMVVYLVNDTDQSIPRAIGENQDVDSEIRIGGNWFPRDPMVLGCGSVLAPRDLPPRHALALGARRSGLGDTDGIIRYSFPTAEVFSTSMQGRYSSAQAEEALAYGTNSIALAEELSIGPGKGRWELGQIAKDPEDFAALLEIVRHHQLCVSQKRQIRDWIERQRQHPNLSEETKRALTQMDETLWKAWICNNDHQTMVNRCVAALEAAPPVQFGTPERCVSVVWKYLCHHGAAEAVDKADPPSKAKLVRLAEAALKGSNLSSRNEAALFLARRTDESEFPASRFHEFLESGVLEMFKAGLEGLERRGRADDAGQWMLRRNPDDPSLCNDYRILRSGLHGEVKEWEAEILKRLLDHHPVETLYMLSVSFRRDSTGLPPTCETSLRQALTAELEPVRRAWWQTLADRSGNGEDDLREQYFPQGLWQGMRQLDRFGAAEDTGLFAAFLDHPAGGFNIQPDGSRIRSFTAREEAKTILLRRHIPLLVEVVTETTFPPKETAKVPEQSQKPTHWGVTAGLYGLVAAAFFIVGFRFWRTRGS